MKFTEISTIISMVFFIGFINSTALGDGSVFENNGFYIEYPSEWDIIDNWGSNPPLVTFSGDIQGNAKISVSYQPSSIDLSKIDDNLLETLNKNEESDCRENRKGLCWNFELLDSKIMAYGDSKAVYLKIGEFLDDKDTIFWIVMIPDGTNNWLILGTAAGTGLIFEGDIEKSIKSFQLSQQRELQEEQAKTPVSSQTLAPHDPAIALEKTITINLILIGEDWDDMLESGIRQKLPSSKDPFVITTKHKAGIRYYYQYNFHSIESQDVEKLSKFMRENSYQVPISGSDIWEFPLGQAWWLYDNHPELYFEEYRLVDANAMEEYLYETHIGSVPSLKRPNTVNLVFLANDMEEVDFLHNYFLSNSDDATEKTHEAEGLMGFGGNYNMFFFDLYAVPWIDFDTSSLDYLVPPWVSTLHDCNSRECFTDLVTYHTRSAISHIVTPDYLYPVDFQPKYLVDAAVYVKPGGSITVSPQALPKFVNEKKILDQLEYLYPYSEWELEVSLEKVYQRGISEDFKKVLDGGESYPIKNNFGEEKHIVLLSSKKIQPELLLWAQEHKEEKAREDVWVIPVLITLDSSNLDVYLDQYGVLGYAPPLPENQGVPCCALGVADQNKVWNEKIGFTDLLIHEVGHVLGLNHPFLSWNDVGDIQVNEYFNWYTSPMTYSSPPNGCGVLFFLMYTDSCGNASLSFTEFERDRITDARLVSLWKKTYDNLENLRKETSIQIGNDKLYSIQKKLDESKDRYRVDDVYSLKGALPIAIEAYSQSVELEKQGELPEQITSEISAQKIPEWIKNNALWWAEDQIDDQTFVNGIQYLIKENVISIPNLPKSDTPSSDQKVPTWIKNNAKWWSDGLISEEDFVKGIEFLVSNGIIKVN